MKHLIKAYIRENYKKELKELAMTRAYQVYLGTDDTDDAYYDFLLSKAQLIEVLKQNLVMGFGYSLVTQEDLSYAISNVLNELIEECSNNILECLENLEIINNL